LRRFGLPIEFNGDQIRVAVLMLAIQTLGLPPHFVRREAEGFLLATRYGRREFS
jgi:hypothetical protein